MSVLSFLLNLPTTLIKAGFCSKYYKDRATALNKLALWKGSTTVMDADAATPCKEGLDFILKP